MGRKNRSISIPEDLSEQIDTAAAAAGITPSAWLVEAARDTLAIQQGIADMNEILAEIGGPPTTEELARADAIIDRGLAFQRGERAPQDAAS